MISIKKLSLCGLLLAGTGFILGMESSSGSKASQLFFKLRKRSKTPEVKSAKLNTEFNTMMQDLYKIAEKIKDPNEKRKAMQFLDRRRDKYNVIIPLSSKLESAVNEIYPILQQEIGDPQQVSMVIDTLEQEFGPSKLQSKILKDMQGDKMRRTFYEPLGNAGEWGLLLHETDKAFNNFSEQDVGTLYNAVSHPREKDVQTVAIEEIKK